MNISPLTIYLWQLADKVSTSFEVISVGCAIFAAVAYVASTYPDLDEDGSNKARKTGFRSLLAAASVLLLSTFLPSSNTVAMMIVIPEIAHSKVVQQDLPDIYNAAVKALKEQISK